MPSNAINTVFSLKLNENSPQLINDALFGDDRLLEDIPALRIFSKFDDKDESGYEGQICIVNNKQ